LNFDYSGPIDGHDIHAVIKVKTITKNKRPFLYITKGRNLKQAEEDQVKYHAPGKFDLFQEKFILNQKKTFLEIPRRIWSTILDLAKTNKNN
jgi:1-deoxy-D-xylulose-5-phosphate synthase